MCNGSKSKHTESGLIMENEANKLVDGNICYNFSALLELTASDDLAGFRSAIEEEGHGIDEPGLWYGRKIGSRKMGFEERTPLMIAAMFGSKDVVRYIINSGCVDVNRACGSDGVTALHCATAGGSTNSVQIVKMLIDASADVDCVDAKGRKPVDLVGKGCGLGSRRKVLEALLNGCCSDVLVLSDNEGIEQEVSTPRAEKKEYPVDLTLPDIKNGIYGTDEFRMYTFKIKPCSRAYSHDWTECPFVHPGENARRRDPRKYHYSCVPCPEFRKGSCRQGDACEYAHGIFECWLHPAQYRTRLCKDETNCNRRVCFFAHKVEELRPLYASTGSAVPSPRSFSNGSSLDMMSVTPLALGSPSMMIPSSSTPPLTPSGASSSPIWQNNQSNVIPPTLQLPGSRLKASLSARDMDYEIDVNHRRMQQQLMDEVPSLPSPSSWTTNALSPLTTGDIIRLSSSNNIKPTNLDDIFGSLDPTILPHVQGLNIRSSYPTQPYTVDHQHQQQNSPMSSRAAAFAKRSQSFIERSSPMNHYRHAGFTSPGTSTATATTMMSPNLADWGSPDGKLDWGIQGEELTKLRKCSSFGFRNTTSNFPVASSDTSSDEPDVSWVQSLVKDGPTRPELFGFDEEQQQCHTGSDQLPAWVEQLYMEQEQMVA